MFRTTSSRQLALGVALSLLATACAGSSAEESPPPARPTTASTTTSTLPATTTTTTIVAPVFSMPDAPAELTELIEGFYAYAAGASDLAPQVPQAVLAGVDGSGETPQSGIAHLGTFAGEELGVVEAGADLFLVVDDGGGWRIAGGEWPSLGIPAYFGGSPRLVAVVGSDARPGQNVRRTRADSIHFIGLDGAGGGAVIGLPRDSYIAVPGFGKKKATASLALGGPDTMMAAFDELTGLPLEGYVLTGFAGFESLLSSVLGGVEVEVPFRINDRWAHVNLAAGLQVLNGAQALGFARARKTVPGGDLTRSEHQGEILIAAARMVSDMGYSAIPGLLEASEPHLYTNLTPEQLLTFSAMSISADLEAMPNIVAPGRTGTAAGASVVFLDNSVATLFEDLADGRLEG